MKGETRSLYVDGKPNNVNLSVFQEQNKQIKKIALQVNGSNFCSFGAVSPHQHRHTRFACASSRRQCHQGLLHTHPGGKQFTEKQEIAFLLLYLFILLILKAAKRGGLSNSSVVIQKLSPLLWLGTQSFQRPWYWAPPSKAAQASSLLLVASVTKGASRFKNRVSHWLGFSNEAPNEWK